MSLTGLISIEFLIVILTALLSIIGYYFHLLRRAIQFVKNLLRRDQPQEEQRHDGPDDTGT